MIKFCPPSLDLTLIFVPSQVPMLQNIHWKELGLLVYVWVGFLAIQIAKVNRFGSKRFPKTSLESQSDRFLGQRKLIFLALILILCAEIHTGLLGRVLGSQWVAGKKIRSSNCYQYLIDKKA